MRVIENLLARRIPKPLDDRFSTQQRLATVIVAYTRLYGDCRREDLTAHGFLPEDIDRLWSMAKALADLELSVMTDENHSLCNHRKD